MNPFEQLSEHTISYIYKYQGDMNTTVMTQYFTKSLPTTYGIVVTWNCYTLQGESDSYMIPGTYTITFDISVYRATYILNRHHLR